MNNHLNHAPMSQSKSYMGTIKPVYFASFKNTPSGKDDHTDDLSEQFFHNTPLATATSNHEYQFIKVNKAFCRLLQYSEAELLKMTIAQITPTTDYTRSVELINKLESKEITSFVIPKTYIRKDKKVISAITIVGGHYDDEDQFIGSTASIFDLSFSFISELDIKNMHFFDQYFQKGYSSTDTIFFNLIFQIYNKELYQKLKLINTNLSPNELEHCAYIKLNLNPKDVAKILSIEPKSVEMARYRIKKKLKLKPTDRLKRFILNL